MPHGNPRWIGSQWPKCWRISRTAKGTAIARVWICFSVRYGPTLEADDAQMHLHLYRDADGEDSFDHFEDPRDTNVEFLRTLPAEASDRVALHSEAGEITLPQMPDEWALHDLGHMRQIAVLVRAPKYLLLPARSAATYPWFSRARKTNPPMMVATTACVMKLPAHASPAVFEQTIEPSIEPTTEWRKPSAENYIVLMRTYRAISFMLTIIPMATKATNTPAAILIRLSSGSTLSLLMIVLRMTSRVGQVIDN